MMGTGGKPEGGGEQQGGGGNDIIILPLPPQRPPDPNGTPAQASTKMRFHVCTLPDLNLFISACDKDLYQWIVMFPPNALPALLAGEKQRIESAALQQQFQQWSSCEASRYTSPPTQKFGLQLQVASRLDGGGTVRANTSLPGIATRLSVSFAPGSAPPQPEPCTPGSDPDTWPKLPFQIAWKVKRMGINQYPFNTVIEFASSNSSTDTYSDGVGPWEGAKVLFQWESFDSTLSEIQRFFQPEITIRSIKVLDHWVTFERIHPLPPPNIEVRIEPYNPAAVTLETSASGHKWHVYEEYTHLESNQSWVFEHWLEGASGWNPLPAGGFSAEQKIRRLSLSAAPISTLDGTWRHRACVYTFQRTSTLLEIRYNGETVESGFSEITPTAAVVYVPGVTAGLARVSENINVYTMGASKASFRILSVEPVPGFGMIFTLKVVNELHIDACIVTPFLSGVSDRLDWQTYDVHFDTPAIWVVRNLGAYSESGPVSIMVPIHLVDPGDWPLTKTHWRMIAARDACACPLNQFADGLYGSAPDGQYPNIGDWPPPAYQVTSSERAFLLAGYLENGDTAIHTGAFSDQTLVTVPARRAPGAEVIVMIDPRFGVNYPTYFDQVPFLGFFEWSVEYKISNNPEVWELRTGKESIGLDLPTALGRYGRYLTLSVAAGKPMWSPYYRKWVTVFDTWPGGGVDELETYLVDTYIRPRFLPEWGFRNFEYTAIKKPFLTASVVWWFESYPISDRAGYIHALTLIKESSSADSVDVVLMGYW
jgi:hypothetical protein